MIRDQGSQTRPAGISAETHTTFELPLNERMRGFLRLEFLFQSVAHHMASHAVLDSRLALSTLLEAADLAGRSDLRSELIKEFERQHHILNVLENNPGVNARRLAQIRDEIQTHLTRLRGCQPGQAMRRDEMVNAVRQRISIPAGTCSFDTPGFHYWLTRDPARRVAQLGRWMEDLRPMEEGLIFALGMIRGAAAPVKVSAVGGFYQQVVDSNLSCQLVRICLPRNSPYFPEISGGKHRFSIRLFVQEDTSVRPVPTEESVALEIQICSF
jgi:cell division protein ZapD